MKLLQTAVRVAARTGVARTGATRMAHDYGGIVPGNARYEKLRRLQDVMTRNDGKLVWQKRGARDTIPYQFTMMTTAIGLVATCTILVTMFFPQAKEE